MAATKRAYISFIAPFSPEGGVVALSGENEEALLATAQIPSLANEAGDLRSKIAVFPNPFNNKVRIRASEDAIAVIQVVNALGQTIYDSRDQVFSNFEIEFGENASGIYFLKFYDHSGALVATKSVVKMDKGL
ncbi:MAG: T9SS type A sorting domain-containing protein [Saprospiraceae bacterium]|nr:T9SS type A sorting domain-containing protein [Saprospiraceae bacterium]MDZ4704900.1 T9SS type A sorting domain-containing protein [Saprospiraceae bacterium]